MFDVQLYETFLTTNKKITYNSFINNVKIIKIKTYGGNRNYVIILTNI